MRGRGFKCLDGTVLGPRGQWQFGTINAGRYQAVTKRLQHSELQAPRCDCHPDADEKLGVG